MVLAKAKKLKSQAPLGATLIVFSSFFYASYGIWTKLIGNFMGGYTAAAWRSVIVLLILVPLGRRFRQLKPVNLKRNWRFILGMTISTLFTWGPLFYAILNAGVGVALTISYAGIVISMFIFGSLFANERFTPDKLISMILSFAGLFLIFTPNVTGAGLLPLIAAFISGISAGANGVFAKLVKYNATQSTIALWSAGAVANIAMALVLRENHPTSVDHVQWLYVLCFALASVAASWSFVRGMKLIEAGAAGILGLLEIVFGVLFGVVLFGERISLLVGLGIVVIIVAAGIPYIKEYRANAQ